MYIFLFLLELLFLFFLSTELTKRLSVLIFHLTKSQNITISFMALLFFPGVVIHELSHFFAAALLFVRTGDIEFIPKMQGDSVKLGSVQIAKTDPFRRFLIGVAPVIVGVVIIASSLWYFIFLESFTYWKIALLLYVLFEVGNTMFSSKKDMEGAWVLAITLAILLGVGYIAGIHVLQFIIDFVSSEQFVNFSQTAALFLLVPILIDILMIGLLKLIQRGRA